MKRIAVATLALTLGFTQALRADVPPGPGESSQGQHAERLRRRLQELQQAASATASAARAPVPSSSAAPAPSSSAASPSLAAVLAQKWAEHLASSVALRERHRAEVVQLLGDRVNDPAVRRELAQHARRLAELTRIEFLVTHARSGAGREQLLRRVAKLTATELARHGARLARLKATPQLAPSSEAPR